jgi:hypothetical protein
MGFLAKLLGQKKDEIVLIHTPQFYGAYNEKDLTNAGGIVNAAHKVATSRLDAGSKLDMYDNIQAAADAADLGWAEQRIVNREISIQVHYAFAATGQISMEEARRYEAGVRAEIEELKNIGEF